MEEKAIELLEQLAQSLGTTIDYLWPVLIQQGKIQIVFFLVALVTASIFTYVAYRMSRNIDYIIDNDLEGLYFPMMFVVLFLVVVSWISTFIYAGDAITGLFNPEYWALKQILELL